MINIHKSLSRIECTGVNLKAFSYLDDIICILKKWINSDWKCNWWLRWMFPASRIGVKTRSLVEQPSGPRLVVEKKLGKDRHQPIRALGRRATFLAAVGSPTCWYRSENPPSPRSLTSAPCQDFDNPMASFPSARHSPTKCRCCVGPTSLGLLGSGIILNKKLNFWYLIITK